jgi:hypothetical protein
VSDRHRAARQALVDAVLQGPAHLAAGVRTGISTGSDVPSGLAALVDKVKRCAYRVTDIDFAPLRSRYSQDELFDAVVSAALGAAVARAESGLRALEEA